MKTTLDQEDIQAIAEKVVELIRPMLSKHHDTGKEDNIFDVKSLCEYLKVSKRWIYERTRFHEIPFFRISKQEMRFNKHDIDKWIESAQELIFNNYSGNVKTLKR